MKEIIIYYFLLVAISCILCFGFSKSSQLTCHYKIPGPSKLTDKIAIVGAGTAGVHMAYLLKKKGFKNIKIFEANGRVGGKCYSFNYYGNPQEMGAIYFGDTENSRELLTDIGIKFGPSRPMGGYWEGGKLAMPRERFFAYKAMQYLKTTNATFALESMQNAMFRLNKLHQELFGKYTGHMMLRPSKNALWQSRGTFKDFLKRHNLGILADVYTIFYSTYGYGKIDQIPALYWLLSDTDEDKFSVLTSGMQKLWETVVKHSKLHVVYNARVVKLRRSFREGRRTFLLTYTTKNKEGISRYGHETADFVIWTPEMKASLNAMGATDQEREIFDRTTNFYFSVFVADTTHVPRSFSPEEVYYDEVQAYDGGIGCIYECFAAQRGYIGDEFDKLCSTHRKQTCSKRFSTVYQYHMTRPRTAILNRTSIYYGERFQKIGKVIRSKVWRYFPHYSCEDMERGILWDIMDMQGKEGIWYLGSSVYFETVNAVMDYNTYLVKSMFVPRE